jgi:CO/xanthine dehydrogenase Mo-binding subunit
MQTRYPVATKVFVGRAASDSDGMASAGIIIEDDGSIRVLARSGLDNAGSAAAIAAVLSEELSMSVDRIRVEAADTTTRTGDGVPVPATVELRSTAVAVRAYLLKQASTYFAMDASELVLNDGRVITFDGRAMTYQDLTRAQEHNASQARTDEGERAVCQRRTPIVDSPAGWDPYEVWLTRVRSPHQSMNAGAAVTVAPRPSITTQLQTA